MNRETFWRLAGVVGLIACWVAVPLIGGAIAEWMSIPMLCAVAGVLVLFAAGALLAAGVGRS